MPFAIGGPDEAVVAYGMGISEPQIIVGGRLFYWSCVQEVKRIRLNVMTISIDSQKVYTQEGVPVSLIGTAQVKVESANRDMLRLAVQHFLGMTQEQIAQVARATLEGHQRAILCTMTVEEIYRDRKKFDKAVFHHAATDFANMGLAIMSYTIKTWSDDVGYQQALGSAATAQAQCQAAIGEANAHSDGAIKSIQADLTKLQAKYTNDSSVARAARDFEVKQLHYQVEVNQRQAQSDLAFQLQSIKSSQAVREEQLHIEVLTRERQIQLAKEESLRKEKELDARVKKPSLAEKYQIETAAEAQSKKALLEAEAEAEAIRARGEAEAFAIREKARAEAEEMTKKAEAWKDYKEAALVDMVLQMLPKVASELSAPLARANGGMTIVSNNGPAGPGLVTAEVLSMIGKLPEMVETITGVNVSQTIAETLKNSIVSGESDSRP
ncbi:flotillin-1 [Capsaspora owczarzaki ATCC 30864]|uniref:Flotillin-1 n=1 Tax=Capsaspora owczarzaki (strain ATCC 30864) TaxID=595528 RepID=A0A0D2U6Y0_CAPO3|nr:flotillin-1 [Capsaspora owczarzaki ATCC 30864]KJE90921.1 flotillin-1 [Capsaspora owczarzaki ATCC 30864]|eukprot:XP_004348901.1 flotillin-1 [Capsaspora owczarzaki ATCC 30864]